MSSGRRTAFVFTLRDGRGMVVTADHARDRAADAVLDAFLSQLCNSWVTDSGVSVAPTATRRSEGTPLLWGYGVPDLGRDADRELADGDRTIEHAFCAGLDERWAIALPELGGYRVARDGVVLGVPGPGVWGWSERRSPRKPEWRRPLRRVDVALRESSGWGVVAVGGAGPVLIGTQLCDGHCPHLRSIC